MIVTYFVFLVVTVDGHMQFTLKVE